MTEIRSTEEIAPEHSVPQGLVIENLVKVYKTGPLEVLALRGLTMRVPLGKIVLITGPSGCGKTTLLNLIGGLDLPTAGNIRFGTNIISKMGSRELEIFRRTHVGYIFQFMNLVSILTAAENIALPMKLAGRSLGDIKARAKLLLDLVGLDKRKDHKPEELSGGEQQRVAIATALANNPPLLLCDEPTGELDSENKREVMKILRELIQKNPDKIMLIVTHDLELQEIADIVLRIKDGVIVEQIEGADLASFKEISQRTASKEPNKTALQVRELKKMVTEISKRLEDLGK